MHKNVEIIPLWGGWCKRWCFGQICDPLPTPLGAAAPLATPLATALYIRDFEVKKTRSNTVFSIQTKHWYLFTSLLNDLVFFLLNTSIFLLPNISMPSHESATNGFSGFAIKKILLRG
jgi:hypothetical protein